jgi:hypothetical protein
MVNIEYRIPIPFDHPAVYQINVQGRIDAHWSDRLAGMKIRISGEQATQKITTLEGEVSDQAALMGVLNTLYELHLPIISVVVLPAHIEEK